MHSNDADLSSDDGDSAKQSAISTRRALPILYPPQDSTGASFHPASQRQKTRSAAVSRIRLSLVQASTNQDTIGGQTTNSGMNFREARHNFFFKFHVIILLRFVFPASRPLSSSFTLWKRRYMCSWRVVCSTLAQWLMMWVDFSQEIRWTQMFPASDKSRIES